MNNLFGNWGLYPSGPETEKQGGGGKEKAKTLVLLVLLV